MLDLRNRKTKKIITAVIVIVLVLAMVIPTLLWALQGVG